MPMGTRYSPHVGRGGLVVGGSYGNGQVYEKGQVAGHVSLAKVSIGFQLGGQVFSEIVFLQDKRAFDEFISNRFEFDASASAVVVVAGRPGAGRYRRLFGQCRARTRYQPSRLNMATIKGWRYSFTHWAA